MQPVLIHVFGIAIHSYVVAQVLGYASAAAIGIWLARKDQRDWRDIIDGIIVIVLSAVLGAKIFHTLFEAQGHILSDGSVATGLMDLLSEDPWHWARLFEAGYVFYGGVVIGTLMGIFFVLRRIPGENPLAAGDYAAPGFLLGGIVIGRLGCLLAGCCYGVPTDGGWAIHFPADHATGGIGVHPVQLYDVIFGVVGVAFCAWYYKRRRFGGELFIFTLAGYAVWRFCTEFFRGDFDRGVWLSGQLSTSQLVSLSVLPVSVAAWFVLNKYGKTIPLLGDSHRHGAAGVPVPSIDDAPPDSSEGASPS